MKRKYVVTYWDGHQDTLLVGDAREAWRTTKRYYVQSHHNPYVYGVTSDEPPVKVVVKLTGEVVSRDAAFRGTPA
jgi:hypothetical protein